MNKFNKNSLRYQLITFRYAFKGLRWFFTSETKAWIHSLCAIAAIFLGIILKISLAEWILIIIAIGFVFVVEIINTGIELLVDRFVKEEDQIAGRIKDMGAGAVLVAAITALAVGFFVFFPKIIELFS